jgi:transposase
MSWFEDAQKDYIPKVFGYRQIAKKYGLSVKTVESRFNRAKKNY